MLETEMLCFCLNLKYFFLSFHGTQVAGEMEHWQNTLQNESRARTLSVINSSLPKVEVAIMKQGYMWICALSQPYSVFPFSDLDKQRIGSHTDSTKLRLSSHHLLPNLLSHVTKS